MSGEWLEECEEVGTVAGRDEDCGETWKTG